MLASALCEIASSTLHCCPTNPTAARPAQLKMAQWPRATKIARQKVPKRDAAKHLTHHIHQTLLKTKAKRAALLFVALRIACDHRFGDAGAVLVTLQLPLCNHCLQLHCSAPRAHTAMQHSCYKNQDAMLRILDVSWGAHPLLWMSVAASSCQPICNCMHYNEMTPTVQSSTGRKFKQHMMQNAMQTAMLFN